MNDAGERLWNTLGRIEANLETLVTANVAQNTRADNQDRRIDAVEKSHSKLIWTGSGVAGAVALVWTAAIAIIK